MVRQGGSFKPSLVLSGVLYRSLAISLVIVWWQWGASKWLGVNERDRQEGSSDSMKRKYMPIRDEVLEEIDYSNQPPFFNIQLTPRRVPLAFMVGFPLD